jgi:ATP-dependent DNA ligase
VPTVSSSPAPRAARPPAGIDWVHEIKHDGYRLIVRRDGEDVHLFIRRGYNWTDRYPAIARAAAKLPATSFTIHAVAVRVVDRTAARLSIYRPEAGAVFAWSLCRGAIPG